MEWTDGIAGGIVLMALGSYKLIGTLSRALIARRNGNGKSNGRVNGLQAHDESALAHKDIRADIEKIDDKLDNIGETSNKILGCLDSMNRRPCQVDCERDGE